MSTQVIRATRGAGRAGMAAAAIALAALLGCSSAAEGEANGPSGGVLPDGSPPTVDPAASGLPCDISAILQRYCIGCHSLPPAASVPMSLVRYEDLTAMRGSPSRTVALRALERMQEGSMPPPPSARPSAAEISTFESWLQAGMPRSACGGSVDAGPTIPNPYDTPLQCSSGRYWMDDEHESPEMHPGGACIDCHARDDEGPSFAIAGTVYRTAHEPDDCYGVAGRSENVVVQITDALGAVLELPVNGAGNFFYEGSVVTPYSAKVIAGATRDRERAMPVKQTSGDCNGCHTEAGANGAPGRIMAP